MLQHTMSAIPATDSETHASLVSAYEVGWLTPWICETVHGCDTYFLFCAISIVEYTMKP